MEQFENYFRRADVDQDGKISGSEAVNFLQGSSLPKHVLAQIWTHADKSHTGFLNREEFYNALKLVTVAQSKRELTPDIVKAALFGPAAAKIPPPQINLAAISAPQSTLATAAPTLGPQIGAVGQVGSQNYGIRGQAPPNTNMSQQYFPAQNNQLLRPSPPTPAGAGTAPPPTPGPQMGAVGQVGSQNYGFRGQAPPNTNMSQQYFPAQNNQLMRPSPPTPAGAGTAPPPPQLGFNNSNTPRGSAMTGPGIQNSNMSNDWLGGRTGGASMTAPMPTSARGSSSFMSSVASNPLDSLSTTSLTTASDPKALGGSGSRPALDSTFGSDFFSAAQSTPKQASTVPLNLENSTPSSAIVPASTVSQPVSKPDPFEMLQSTYTRQLPGGQQQQTQLQPKPNQQISAPIPASSQQSGTPAAARSSTSEQSQSPWPKMTPAGVQKYAKLFIQVDSDRDGRITGEQARNLFLSWRLPRDVLKQVWDLSDQDSDSMLSLREFCVALYMMERYREGRSLPPSLPSSVMLDETLLSMAGPPASGYGAVGWGAGPGLRPPQVLPENQSTRAGVRPPMPSGQHQHFNNQGTRRSSNGSTQVNLHSNGKQAPSVPGQETNTENEGERNAKMLLDSKEKLEYYRSKMQDLVLYKSRCDNRLNEITERALADKREAEMLGKKYEEKYKHVAEIASKLTIEEASFREIQGRKTELQEAIKKMEQGGSADGILQVRADRIQSDLEELLKGLAERYEKHKVDLKSAAIIELPPGWQPGIPEVAAVWDEDWDKFEDEGFSFDVAISANTKAQSPQSESSPTHRYSSDTEAHTKTTFDQGSNLFEVESAFTHSEDESKSPQASPRRQETSESPSREYSDNHFSSFDEDAEAHGTFDDPTWGSFDNNDDIDSVWGFNTKDPDHEKDGEKYFFDSNNSVSSPTRMDSPRKDDFSRNSSPFFADSVPGSPQSRAGNSPRYSTGSVDPFFDGFSRFDSFRANDHASSPRKETFTRFDSMNSSRGFDFDDSDPFGSSGPFKVSSESQNSKKDSDSWNAF